MRLKKRAVMSGDPFRQAVPFTGVLPWQELKQAGVAQSVSSLFFSAEPKKHVNAD
jgi:hypothetical protein